jgi:hypothetical protein
MSNMLICCTFMASATVVSLLPFKNTVDGFLCAEFRILECFPACSIHCVTVIRFPVLIFHLNKHVNNTWRNRKTFLKWYAVALRLALGDFLHHSVIHEHMYGEHCTMSASTHFTHSVCKTYTRGTGFMRLEFCQWLRINRQLLPLILFADDATFTRNGISNNVTGIDGLTAIHI